MMARRKGKGGKQGKPDNQQSSLEKRMLRDREAQQQSMQDSATKAEPVMSPTPPNSDGVQSLAQKRAKDALSKVKSLIPKGADPPKYGNYVSYVKALPATIIMSGLGQAMAMEKAGASKSGIVGAGHKTLYDHLQSWLCEGWEHGPYSGDLLSAITSGSEDDYIRAQAEAMEYLEWLKKFAVAFLADDEGGTT